MTAITLVALGTSLPDLFASKTAALQEKYADNSIGNVTGSNSVNVFLGLGLPWLMASIYWHIQTVSAGCGLISLFQLKWHLQEASLFKINELVKVSLGEKQTEVLKENNNAQLILIIC